MSRRKPKHHKRLPHSHPKLAKNETAPSTPGSADEQAEVKERMAEGFRGVASAPGGFSFISFAEATLAGTIQDSDADTVGDLIDGLLSVAKKALLDNDAIARKQLAAIDRLVYPLDYGFSLTKIEEIANFKISQSLIRAWAVLEIMRRLSFVLEQPASRKRVKRKKAISDIERAACGSQLFELVMQDELWTSKKRNTLKSLGINLYLKINGKEAADEDTLYRDLQSANKWLEQNPGGLMKLMPEGASVDLIPVARTPSRDRQTRKPTSEPSS